MTSTPAAMVPRWLLVLFIVCGILAFLRWSAAATMPLAVSLFIIALAAPLEQKLEHRLPRWLSLLITVLVLIAVLAILIGALVYTGDLLARRAPDYGEKLQSLWKRGQEKLDSLSPGSGSGATSGSGGGASEGGSGGGASGGGAPSVFAIAMDAVRVTYDVVGFILVALAFSILGLIEVRSIRRRMTQAFPTQHEAIALRIRLLTKQYVEYLKARTIAGLITGVATWGFCALLGVDLALIWGLIGFLLNYIPTLGSIVAVFPPALFALVQFDQPTMALWVLLGLGSIQLFFGNYIDPLIQGHYLEMSPWVILASVIVWGWVWGIPGALLGVPITVGIMLVTAQFPSTEAFARLISRDADQLVPDRPPAVAARAS